MTRPLRRLVLGAALAGATFAAAPADTAFLDAFDIGDAERRVIAH